MMTGKESTTELLFWGWCLSCGFVGAFIVVFLMVGEVLRLLHNI